MTQVRRAELGVSTFGKWRPFSIGDSAALRVPTLVINGKNVTTLLLLVTENHSSTHTSCEAIAIGQQ